MAEGDNKISIGIEAEIGQLQSGLRRAEEEVKASGRRMEQLAQANAKKIGRAIETYGVVGGSAATYSQYGVRNDSLFGDMARQADSVRELRGEVAKTSTEMETLAKRANILLAVQGAVGAFRAIGAVTAAMRGDWDGVQSAVDRLPMGIGALNQALRETVFYIAGIDEEMAQLASTNKRIDANIAERKSQIVGGLDLDAAKKRLEAEKQSAEYGRQRIENEARLAQLVADSQRKLFDMQSSGASVDEQRRFIRLYEIEYERIWTEGKRRLRELADEVKRRQEQAANESAKGLVGGVREWFDEALKRRVADLNLQIKALREREEAMKEDLKAAQSVTGANFVKSIGTQFGDYKFAQSGAADAVARAQLRAAELLEKIAKNTEEANRLLKEKESLTSPLR